MSNKLCRVAILAFLLSALPCLAQSGDFDSLLQSGDSLSDEGKWGEAAKVYKLATQLNPKSAEAFLRLGDALMGAGQWYDALAAYQQSAKLDDRNPDAHYALGNAYNELGQHGNAFKPFVRAVQLDPQFAEAHYGIGYAYLNTDQHEKAVPYLRNAVRLKPDYLEALYDLALAYAHLGNTAAVEEQRRKLAALDPKSAGTLDAELKRLGVEAASTAPSVTATQPPAGRSREQTAKTTDRPTNTTRPPRARAGRTSRRTGAPEQAGSQATRENAQTVANATPPSPPMASKQTPSAPPASTQTATTRPPADPAFELAFWDTIKNSKDPEDFRAYLRKYPDGVFADLARRRASGTSPDTTSTGNGAGTVSKTAAGTGAATNTLANSTATTSENRAVAKPAAGTSSGSGTGLALAASYKGLRPGMSTRAEVESALGSPLRASSAAMVEYPAQSPARRVYVEYRTDSPVAKQITLYLEGTPARASVLQSLKLQGQPDATKKDAKGRHVEYFGGPPHVMLTHVDADPAGAIFSVGYISPEAFEKAAGKPAPGRQKPPKAVNTTARTSPPAPPQPSGPTYDELMSRANTTWFSANDAGSALRLAQQAVALDPKRAEAFQLLGIVQLYGNKNYAAAGQAMRAAVERGGAASFGVTHDHSGSFQSNCQGTLHVSKTGVAFDSRDPSHNFQAAPAQIREAKANNLLGIAFGAFHIKVEQQPGKTKNYNFAPGTSRTEETSLILSLIPSQ